MSTLFAMLTEDEQRAAIHRLANSGVGDNGIASIVGLPLEVVRMILGERSPTRDGCVK
jgi:hypothetical protein